MHIHAGDKIDFSLLEGNEVLLRPVTKAVDDVFGCLHAATTGKKASVAEMDAAIQSGCSSVLTFDKKAAGFKFFQLLV